MADLPMNVVADHNRILSEHVARLADTVTKKDEELQASLKREENLRFELSHLQQHVQEKVEELTLSKLRDMENVVSKSKIAIDFVASRMNELQISNLQAEHERIVKFLKNEVETLRIEVGRLEKENSMLLRQSQSLTSDIMASSSASRCSSTSLQSVLLQSGIRDLKDSSYINNNNHINNNNNNSSISASQNSVRIPSVLPPPPPRLDIVDIATLTTPRADALRLAHSQLQVGIYSSPIPSSANHHATSFNSTSSPSSTHAPPSSPTQQYIHRSNLADDERERYVAAIVESEKRAIKSDHIVEELEKKMSALQILLASTEEKLHLSEEKRHHQLTQIDELLNMTTTTSESDYSSKLTALNSILHTTNDRVSYFSDLHASTKVELVEAKLLSQHMEKHAVETDSRLRRLENRLLLIEPLLAKESKDNLILVRENTFKLKSMGVVHRLQFENYDRKVETLTRQVKALETEIKELKMNMRISSQNEEVAKAAELKATMRCQNQSLKLEQQAQMIVMLERREKRALERWNDEAHLSRLAENHEKEANRRVSELEKKLKMYEKRQRETEKERLDRVKHENDKLQLDRERAEKNEREQHRRKEELKDAKHVMSSSLNTNDMENSGLCTVVDLAVASSVNNSHSPPTANTQNNNNTNSNSKNNISNNTNNNSNNNNISNNNNNYSRNNTDYSAETENLKKAIELSMVTLRDLENENGKLHHEILILQQELHHRKNLKSFESKNENSEVVNNFNLVIKSQEAEILSLKDAAYQAGLAAIATQMAAIGAGTAACVDQAAHQRMQEAVDELYNDLKRANESALQANQQLSICENEVEVLQRTIERGKERENELQNKLSELMSGQGLSERLLEENRHLSQSLRSCMSEIDSLQASLSHVEKEILRLRSVDHLLYLNECCKKIRNFLKKRRVSRTMSILVLSSRKAPELRKERKRLFIVQEIVKMEAAYCKHLHIAIAIYFVGLKEKKNLIKSDVADSIFSNLTVLYAIHKEFLEEITEVRNSKSMRVLIGDLFCHFCERVTCYYTYAKNYSAALKTITDLKKKSPALAEFLSNLASQQSCDFQSLESFLFMPIQRMPRYVMILKSLLDETPPNHIDYQQLKRAVDVMQEIAIQINKCM